MKYVLHLYGEGEERIPWGNNVCDGHQMPRIGETIKCDEVDYLVTDVVHQAYRGSYPPVPTVTAVKII